MGQTASYAESSVQRALHRQIQSRRDEENALLASLGLTQSPSNSLALQQTQQDNDGNRDKEKSNTSGQSTARGVGPDHSSLHNHSNKVESSPPPSAPNSHAHARIPTRTSDNEDGAPALDLTKTFSDESMAFSPLAQTLRTDNGNNNNNNNNNSNDEAKTQQNTNNNVTSNDNNDSSDVGSLISPPTTHYSLHDLWEATAYLPDSLLVNLRRLSLLYCLDFDGDGKFSLSDINQFLDWAIATIPSPNSNNNNNNNNNNNTNNNNHNPFQNSASGNAFGSVGSVSNRNKNSDNNNSDNIDDALQAYTVLHCWQVSLASAQAINNNTAALSAQSSRPSTHNTFNASPRGNNASSVNSNGGNANSNYINTDLGSNRNNTNNNSYYIRMSSARSERLQGPRAVLMRMAINPDIYNINPHTHSYNGSDSNSQSTSEERESGGGGAAATSYCGPVTEPISTQDREAAAAYLTAWVLRLLKAEEAAQRAEDALDRRRQEQHLRNQRRRLFDSSASDDDFHNAARPTVGHTKIGSPLSGLEDPNTNHDHNKNNSNSKDGDEQETAFMRELLLRMPSPPPQPPTHKSHNSIGNSNDGQQQPPTLTAINSGTSSSHAVASIRVPSVEGRTAAISPPRREATCTPQRTAKASGLLGGSKDEVDTIPTLVDTSNESDDNGFPVNVKKNGSRNTEADHDKEDVSHSNEDERGEQEEESDVAAMARLLLQGPTYEAELVSGGWLTASSVEVVFRICGVEESYGFSFWDFCRLLNEGAAAEVEEALGLSAERAARECDCAAAIEERRAWLARERLRGWQSQKRTSQQQTGTSTASEKDASKRNSSSTATTATTTTAANNNVEGPAPVPLFLVSELTIQFFVFCFIRSYWGMLHMTGFTGAPLAGCGSNSTNGNHESRVNQQQETKKTTVLSVPLRK